MAILDSKGRLFGKVSILDLGAALVILLVVVGIFFFPGTSGSVAQLNGKKTCRSRCDCSGSECTRSGSITEAI